MKVCFSLIVALLCGLLLFGCKKTDSPQTEKNTNSATIFLKTDSSTARSADASAETSDEWQDSGANQPDSAAQTIVCQDAAFTRADYPDGPSLMPGSDTFAYYIHGEDRLFLYSRFVIVIYDQKEYAGDSMAVFPFDSAGDSLRISSAVEGKPVFSSGEMGTWFNGMLDRYLLLDQGTGPQGGVEVYYLSDSATLIYSGDCSNDIRVVRPDSLLFDEQIDRKPTERECPEIAEQLASGLGTVLQERVMLSLRSGYKRRTGEISCTEVQ